MKKLLVCQHVAYEILGTLDPLFREAGFRIRYINFERDPNANPNIEHYDGLVILGGPMNVEDSKQYPHLLTEILLIQNAIARNIPILGICLGAQLIAKALKANVQANTVKEIGWYDVSLNDAGQNDPLFKHFNQTEKLFQWHGHFFDIPENAIHLASTSTCQNQAFRFRDNVYAFQFHLEVNEELITRWLSVPLYQKELETIKQQTNPQTIQDDTSKYMQRLNYLSKITFMEFIKLIGNTNKQQILPSR